MILIKNINYVKLASLAHYQQNQTFKGLCRSFEPDVYKNFFASFEY